jgi:hypothetical protein
MKNFTIVALVLGSIGQSAAAATKEFCGKRDGTAGNAALVDSKGSEVVTLAIQGEGDSLLEQTDKLIGRKSGVKGEQGTQNGKNYCVLAELNSTGEPVKILKAWLKK